jgi:hypothetical protein
MALLTEGSIRHHSQVMGQKSHFGSFELRRTKASLPIEDSFFFSKFLGLFLGHHNYYTQK